MKIIVLALLAVAVSVYAAAKEDSSEEDSFKECLIENDIKEGEIEKLMKKEDPKLYCLMACIYEKEGILKNGELNENELVKSILEDLPKLKEETVHKTVDMCKEKVNDVTDVCDLTNAITKCLQEILDEESGVKD